MKTFTNYEMETVAQESCLVAKIIQSFKSQKKKLIN